MPKEKPKVLLVNKGHHYYDEAGKFGELIALTEGKINVFAISNLKADIEQAIDSVAKEDDYLLLSGHIIPNAIAVHYLLKKFNRVNMLVWIGNQNQYKIITLLDKPHGTIKTCMPFNTDQSCGCKEQ